MTLLSQKFKDLIVELEELEKQLTPPVPTPAPAPVPTPVPSPPPPAPVEPPKEDTSSIVKQEIKTAELVLLQSFHNEGRYERFRRLHVLSGNTATIPFSAFSFLSGGRRIPLKSSKYELYLQDKLVSTANVTSGATSGVFVVDLSLVSPGWNKVEIRGLASTETNPTWYVYKLGDANHTPEFLPVVKGTYELSQRGDNINTIAYVPSKYAPNPVPLNKRTYVGFSGVIPRKELNCTQTVPLRFGDVHRPNVNKDGVLSSFDLQSYFWHNMTAKLPKVPLLDGPRGVGTLAMTTHVEIGQAAPGGIPRNNIYACDPWRVVKISEDGTIKTLVGYRHKNNIPSYWENPPQLDLIGDWSEVPADRRGFHELWGMAWDERTLEINPNTTPIKEEDNQQPHIVGPVMFLADSQNNRICKVEFSPISHTAVPKVVEFITNIQDPWDIVYYEGLLYITERKSHRIGVYSADDGSFVKTLVQGAPLASIDRNRFVKRLVPLDQIRREQVVAPEGLFKLKNDPWMYFSSVAMGQVKRVNLITGVVEVVCDVPTNGNSNYFKIAVSDGSFGPRGTVFVWSWQNGQYGYPFTWLPAGSGYTNWQGTRQEWKWYDEKPVFGQWAGFVYATAGAVGQGRLICGGANEGLLTISLKLSEDRAITASIERGAKEYKDRGLHLVHGEHGFGFYSLPLPWGLSVDIDNYLTFHGHIKK